MSVFDSNSKINHMTANAFLDPNGGVTIQRYDCQKYPFFEKITEKQLGFFWLPTEVDLIKDQSDFKSLSAHEQHIFTSNLKRQILLDSVQGRSPNLAFLPIVSLPEIEAWIQTWAWNETIHSRSYTHIIRNIYPDPSVIFDELTEIEEIVDCAKDISRNYDELIRLSMFYQLLGEGIHTINGEQVPVSLYDLKTKLWKAIVSVNILEGIRFYVSFACSWAFAENKKMEGNAKIIKFICRDENIHLGVTQTLMKILPKDDPDYERIRQETYDSCVKLFVDAIEQEKAWARYLFKDGSMVGLTEKILCDYVEWIGTKRMNVAGFKSPYKVGSNPLPWTNRWIAGAEVQVAPQETEITSYTIGQTKKDVDKKTFEGFSL
jgi:ribonucleoside-diphosphate reductase beta chain